VTAILHERARRARERALIRAWEYRQRSYSKGVWYRLRRVLVEAAQAWIIDETDADRLETLGRVPHPVGRELEPPKRIFLLGEEESSMVRHREQVPVRLCSRLLNARSLLLVLHRGAEGASLPDVLNR